MEKRSRHILAGAIGNTLEFYDFAVFAYLAPIIGNLFFPSTDQLASILKAYTILAVGFLVRPLGGVLFGHFADRLGRKKTLQVSIVAMAIPTALVGCLPTYAQIGATAAVLLLVLRILQGLSVGGEGIGSFAFLGEMAEPEHRGLQASWGAVSAGSGYLLGSAVAFLLQTEVDRAILYAWGWRIPFLIGALPAVFGVWIRAGLPETVQFERARASGDIEKIPVLGVLKQMPGTVIRVACLILLLSTSNIVFLWMPTYLTHIVKPGVETALLINTLAMAFMMLMQIVGGSISDRVGRRAVFIASALGCMLLSYPLFLWIDQSTTFAAVGTQLIFAVLLGVAWGTLPAVLAEMFPTRMRVSGNAVAYNVAMGLVGGSAPLVATWLIARTGDIAAPAYYVILLSGIGLVAALGLPSRHGEALE